MAYHLVTAKKGEDHVSSADEGAAYAAIIGNGRYVTNEGNGLALSFNSANEAVLATGSIFIDGRFWRCTSPETLALQSGTQAMMRHDVVGILYTRDASTGEEDGVPYVYTGTPAESNPSDPDLPTGRIDLNATTAFAPLHRIVYDGVSIARVEFMGGRLGNVLSCPWPVGAVLNITSAHDPNDEYPGTTWQRWDGGMVALSAGGNYTAGTKYGSNTKTITTANMPKHAHTIGNNSHAHGLVRTSNSVGGYKGSDAWWQNGVILNQGQGGYGDGTTASSSHGHSCSEVGSGQAFNVMQESMAVYTWERVA